jgi:hypothetical protein
MSTDESKHPLSASDLASIPGQPGAVQLRNLNAVQLDVMFYCTSMEPRFPERGIAGMMVRRYGLYPPSMEPRSL